MDVTLSFFTLPQISKPLFFFFFNNTIATISLSQFFFPISAMPLPQLVCHKFFFPISAMALPQLVCHKFFFFFTLWALHARYTPDQQELGRGISVFTLPKFNIFSLLFLLLSHTFFWISAMVIPKFTLFPHNPK